ncbi:HAMP domain-containing sensor histidine kinase [Clostridium sp. JS66]|uniref:sensor histidine kinase n=1 Tax=Clostridium sp. JS66 TaxID=3064705 RepID=UPI00298DC8C7|nr:HAMP domain-containing sensor histidine kinase [Clostridium sp. JS66]WPC43443.1 HAMP domain-containing sensor histidine kinase [Clostridium sp. JS66]
MKIFYKIVLRILIVFIILLFCFFISFIVITLMFISVKYNTPMFKSVKANTFQFCSVLALFFIFLYMFIYIIAKPVNNMFRWLRLLSDESYKEEDKTELLEIRNLVKANKWPYILYKELIFQINSLTEILLENEVQHKLLEENRRQWIAGITHDLKTPLAYIRGYSSMITAPKYEWDNTQIKGFVEKIEEKSVHMENLINDLSTSLKFYSGDIFLKKSAEDMIPYIQQIVIDIANNPLAKEYSFSFNSKLKKYALHIDTQLIRRALQNVIMNAVLHNPRGTNIQVTVDKVENYFQIQVEDDGNGIDEETLKNMFQKYFRGSSTDGSVEGSGLGMSLSKQFIECHGGFIEVISKKNIGTCVTIKLPA